jgi:hypothetical protein
MTVNSKIRIVWKETVLEYFMIISRVLLMLEKLSRNKLQ